MSGVIQAAEEIPRAHVPRSVQSSLGRELRDLVFGQVVETPATKFAVVCLEDSLYLCSHFALEIAVSGTGETLSLHAQRSRL